jgi:hypothetical protein
MLVHALLWLPLDVGSFVTLTITQGWGAAVISKAVAFLLPWILPMLYDHHLRNIRHKVEGRSLRNI